MKRLLYIVLFCCSVAMPLAAQTYEEILRPIASSYTVGVGSAHIADTYLSPINYNGWSTSLNYQRWQAMKLNPQNWVMKLDFGVDINRALNRAGNAAMWYAGVNASWTMMRRWNVVRGLTLGIGPAVQLDLGCMYLSRNSNNPAAAKAAFTVGASGYASYNLRLGRLPVTLVWAPSLPAVGAFFSPDYGELYYEIYLGNHSGLAHCAWWGNYFRVDNNLTANLHFGATALTLGYKGSVLSTKVNHLVTNHFTHQFVIGIAGEWLSLNPRKQLSPKAKIYHALYE